MLILFMVYEIVLFYNYFIAPKMKFSIKGFYSKCTKPARNCGCGYIY